MAKKYIKFVYNLKNKNQRLLINLRIYYKNVFYQLFYKKIKQNNYNIYHKFSLHKLRKN